eukprot:m.363520 g.363520  ORF g.363520 m.363520 type:complete len:85 (-) comp22860_c0_seq1:378-632(-)
MDSNTPLRAISRDEVSQHCSMNDCWVIINSRVYNVTQFLPEHPGGEDVVMDWAGRDGTSAFADIGHSASAREILETYCIGTLAE